MKVPLVDLVAQQREIADEVNTNLAEVFASASFVGGPAVTEFEKAYADTISLDFSRCFG